MTIDPIVATLAGTISTMAVFIVRMLIQRAERAEKDADEWQARYFRQAGMTDMALDEAEKREKR